MKTTKKKNSATKKLLPAVGMLAISATMLATSTYAWFTMNKEVQVTNMVVQAKADQGLLINEVEDGDDANWDALATTSQGATGIKLHATSTAETGTWYAAYSTSKSNAAAASEGSANALLADGYHTLGTTGYSTAVEDVIDAAGGTSALTQVTYVDRDQDTEYDDGEGYYVKYTYWLKSSGDAITLSPTGAAKTLNIQELSVTGNSGSEDLDKALRVAIVVNGKAYIYAPLYADNALPTYYVAASDDETTPLAKGTSQPTAMETLPAVTEDGTPVYVYLYFEGEDVNLKTDNVTETLDNLTVTFKFALVDHATTVTDNGVDVS